MANSSQIGNPSERRLAIKNAGSKKGGPGSKTRQHKIGFFFFRSQVGRGCRPGMQPPILSHLSLVMWNRPWPSFGQGCLYAKHLKEFHQHVIYWSVAFFWELMSQGLIFKTTPTAGSVCVFDPISQVASSVPRTQRCSAIDGVSA